MPQHPSELSASPQPHSPRSQDGQGRSVLAWPAWRRVAAVAPVLGLLWLAVGWAMVEVAPL